MNSRSERRPHELGERDPLIALEHHHHHDPRVRVDQPPRTSILISTLFLVCFILCFFLAAILLVQYTRFSTPSSMRNPHYDLLSILYPLFIHSSSILIHTISIHPSHPAHQVLNTNLLIMIFKIDLLVIEYMLIILTIALLIDIITLI